MPPATVRGWLRRLRFRAEEMRCFAMFQLGVIGGTDPALPGPAASPLHDALNAVAAAAHPAIAGHGFERPRLYRFGTGGSLAVAAYSDASSSSRRSSSWRRPNLTTRIWPPW